jgi:hypothetical protein
LIIGQHNAFGKGNGKYVCSVGLELHGHIRLDLHGASQDDVQSVMLATGACRNASDGQPDVEVRFTKSAPDVVWRHLGQRDAYYAEGQFALGCDHFKSPVPMVLPAAAGPEPFRVTYPSGGGRRLPWLRSMINGKCVDKQLLGVHAAAFTFEDRGCLVCGWPRGGKTGTLLAFLLHGAQYLAAEWVYVSHQGRTMQGVPEHIRLRDWHLRQGGTSLKLVGWGGRMRLIGRRWAANGTAGISRVLGAFLPGDKSLRKLAAGIDRHRYVDRPAADWLGQQLQPRTAPLDTILLVGTHDARDIQVTRLGTEEAKRRLIVLQDEDQEDLTWAYRRWAYAMSDPSAWLADFEEKRSVLLDQLIEGKAVYAVDHPEEVNLIDLFQELQSSV